MYWANDCAFVYKQFDKRYNPLIGLCTHKVINDKGQTLWQWHTAILRIFRHPFIRIFVSHASCYYLIFQSIVAPSYYWALDIKYSNTYNSGSMLLLMNQNSNSYNENKSRKIIFQLFSPYLNICNDIYLKNKKILEPISIFLKDPSFLLF